ncbi:MAG TPA: VCBS repeat-containing protein [Gammaproteobacteria bacterium]|nr:VCBS repeat-containing protein [Gammaproteobacteria bacterium]
MQTKHFFTSKRLGAALVGMVVAAAASAATLSYVTGTTVQVGTNVYSMATANFTGQGRQDMVTSDGTFWVNTSPGDGTVSFTAGPTMPAAISVAAADLNGDGKPDLIQSYGTNQIAVFINTTPAGATSPTFAAPVYFNTGTDTNMVMAVDLNGDGLPDLVALDWGANQVDVLMNTTTGGALSFSNFQGFNVGSGSNWVAAGDLNGDGKPDLVVTNTVDNTVSVLINNTTTSSSTAAFYAQQVFSVGNLPYSVALADVDGDGIDDIIVGNNSENDISVLINTTTQSSTSTVATASFGAEQTFATGSVPNSVVAVDVNGNGKSEDIVAGNASDGTVSVFQNTATSPGAASFAPEQPFTVGTSPAFMVVADMNGDGKPDLAVLNSEDANFGWWGSISVLLQ